MNAKFVQFYLLVWKNFTLQKRKKLATFLEIGLPLIFSIILVLVRRKVSGINFTNGTYYRTENIENFYSGLCPTKPLGFCYVDLVAPEHEWNLYYTPNNSVFVEFVMENLKDLKSVNDTISFENESEMVSTLMTEMEENLILPVLGAIVFTHFPEPDSNGVYNMTDVKYKIRLRYSWYGSDAGNLESIFDQIATNWNTRYQFPGFQSIGPRSNNSQVGGPPYYFQDGFLTLQLWIDRAITNVLTGKEHSYDVGIRRMPYPPWKDDVFILVLQQQFPFIVMLSFLFAALYIVKDLVHEKETRMKETLKLLGVHGWLHWSAWVTKYLLFLLITVTIMTLLLCLPLVRNGSVVGYTQPGVLFLLLFMYAVATIAFACLISVFFSKANTGAAAAGIIFFLTYIPYIFLQKRYTDMSFGAKLGASLLSNVAISFGAQIIAMFEGTGSGAQWSNLASAVSVDDDFSLLVVLTMLLIDSLIYWLLAWYIEAVWPGEFGVPQPLYFPFTKVYWCGTSYSDDDEESIPLLGNLHRPAPDLYEHEPHTLPVGVQCKHLTKEFGSKKAVEDFTMSMYENQITALLGHNGAGKTTTIAMLTGFTPPSSGTATVNGCDIRLDIAGVRNSLGLCPQQNVLFNDLTVIEHLWFFAKLKGYRGEDLTAEVDKYLANVQLQVKRNDLAGTLSGGQKRKLCIGIALIGGSKVIILDEPTSGVDTGARRLIWQLLQNNKKGRTMLLTTHHMDEADVLGDRIAIMANGQIKCCGSPVFLKRKFGAGYHLSMVRSDSCDLDRVTSLITGQVAGAQLVRAVSAEVCYVLPYDQRPCFAQLFKTLQLQQDELGLQSLGVSITTMEEVFLKVAEPSDVEDSGDHGYSSSLSSVQSDITDNSDIVEDVDHLPLIPNPDMGVCYRLLQQFKAMFIKRMLHAWRSKPVLLAQILVPLLFTILSLIIVVTLPGPEDSPPLTLTLEHFHTVHVPYQYSPGVEDLARTYTRQFTKYRDVLTEPVGPNTAHTANLEEYIVDVGKHDLAVYNEEYMIGAFMNFSKGQPVDLESLFNNQAFHTSAISLGAVMNGLLGWLTNSTATITTTNHPLPRTSQQQINEQLVQGFEGFIVSVCVMFGMAFLVSTFSLFVIKERASKAKHLQYVGGVQSEMYWSACFCWDYINYILACALLVVAFAAFHLDGYTQQGRIWCVLCLFLLFGWAVIPFIYLLSYLFTVPATGLIWLTMFNILSGIATVLTIAIISIPQLGTATLAIRLRWSFLSFLPNFCVGDGLSQMYTNYQLVHICTENVYIKAFCDQGGQSMCCQNNCTDMCIPFTTNPFSWEDGGIGRHLFFMCMQGVVYFGLLLLLQSDMMRALWYKVLGMMQRHRMPARTVAPDEGAIVVAEDEDVCRERQQVHSVPENDRKNTGQLLTILMSKYYGHTTAVDRLSLCIQGSECFGLLGVNGAGKTSTFKMLTGDEFISSGEAYLAGYSVKTEIKQVQHNIGYCPQFDALPDKLTGREILFMFARLRGVPEPCIPSHVNTLMQQLGLTKYAKIIAQNYSGGNKRKLSTAIALVGFPPIIFLDEPSTGMDPMARRQLWNVLANIRQQGKTLVLTSHSMEECEALCTRLAVMVNGQLKCLGSPQHLKTKFGQGFSLLIKLSPDQPISGPIQQVESLYPGRVAVKAAQPGLLYFHLTDPAMAWAQLFEELEEASQTGAWEDYFLSQTTLEQVFLTFAQAQVQPLEELATGGCRTWSCGCC